MCRNRPDAPGDAGLRGSQQAGGGGTGPAHLGAPAAAGQSVIVVDSSVWIDFFNGVSTPEVQQLDGLLRVTPVAIGDLILVEVVRGFRQELPAGEGGGAGPKAVPLFGAAVDARRPPCLEGCRERSRAAAPRHHSPQINRRDHRHRLHRGQPAAAVQ